MEDAPRREDAGVVVLHSVDVIVGVAKKGLKQPSTLTDKEIEAVCRTLLYQLAQMGIGQRGERRLVLFADRCAAKDAGAQRIIMGPCFDESPSFTDQREALPQMP